ncbi:MAG TPA: amino acid transporter, partial [Gemmataceae bacterium]|nr:amino acid transporter [Gemmataceae bacterium]
VPHRPGHRDLASKEESIRAEHRLGPEVPIVFVEAQLGDTSDFYQAPLLAIRHEQERFILRITHCASIAHAIAAAALELSRTGQPPEIHFGWSNESPMAANVSFVLFGEGNVPWIVRELIRAAEPDPARQPRVVIG